MNAWMSLTSLKLNASWISSLEMNGWMSNKPRDECLNEYQA